MITSSPISTGEFAEFYGSHFRQVTSFLARSGCASHVVEDLAQETFLRAWNGRERFSGSVQFRTWLLGIARNAAREYWRRSASAEAVGRRLFDDPAERGTGEPDTADVVRAAVARLPPKQRGAITLVYLHGVSQRDAALQCNCAQVAFRRRLANGRAKLRTLLHEQGASFE